MTRWALLAVAAALTGCAAAPSQPTGYYPDPFTAAYAYRYDAPRAYGPEGDYTPYSWPNGYDGYHTPAVVP